MTLNEYAMLSPTEQAAVIQHERVHESHGHTSTLLADLRLLQLVELHAKQGMTQPAMAKDHCAMIVELLRNIRTAGVYDKTFDACAATFNAAADVVINSPPATAGLAILGEPQQKAPDGPVIHLNQLPESSGT